MILGRVITSSKKLSVVDFIEKTSEYISNDRIPTLIVGKTRASELLGCKLSAIDRKINDNLFWTYLKTEKRSEFESDLQKFNLFITERIKSSCDYYPICLFESSRKLIKGLISYFKNSIKKYVYITPKHIYSYSEQGKKKVIGISLYELKYMGVNTDKLISRLKTSKDVVMINDDKFIGYELKKNIKNIDIYIPYLRFLKEQ